MQFVDCEACSLTLAGRPCFDEGISCYYGPFPLVQIE